MMKSEDRTRIFPSPVRSMGEGKTEERARENCPRISVRFAAMVFAATMLAACSSSESTRVDDAPGPSVIQPEPTVPTGPMKAGDIMRVLSGNSFRYARPVNRTGTTTFNSDGTFSYQESGKGEGSGIWQASDGSLCEAFNPTSFLPRGTRTECHPFKQNAQGAYSAGKTTFETM